MRKLPPNPTPEQYQEFYDQLSPEQQTSFRKRGTIKMLETIYGEGSIDELVEDETPKPGSIFSGVFIDRSTGGGDRRFVFTIGMESGEPVVDYRPQNPKELEKQIEASA